MIATGCAPSACATSSVGRPPGERIVFYLHGAIVENEGPRGTHPVFGEYDFEGIVAALREPGVQVIAEQRPKGTDTVVYADRLAQLVQRLLLEGVAPADITIIGASKGAVMAALVSTRLAQPQIRYVLMGNCNDWLIRTHRPRLSGRVLSIYEDSDKIGGSCQELVAGSPGVTEFSEIKLSTSLGHGFLYRPLSQWLGPARAWSRAGRKTR